MVGAGVAIRAAQRNWTGRVHICWVGGGAVLCIALISWVILGRVSFECLRKWGPSMEGGE